MRELQSTNIGIIALNLFPVNADGVNIRRIFRQRSSIEDNITYWRLDYAQDYYKSLDFGI